MCVCTQIFVYVGIYKYIHMCRYVILYVYPLWCPTRVPIFHSHSPSMNRGDVIVLLECTVENVSQFQAW